MDSLAFGGRKAAFYGRDARGLREGSLTGATITSVSLRLLQASTMSTPTEFSVYRATANRGEGASNAGTLGGNGTASTPNDATWIHRFNPGSFCTTVGGDCFPAASATTTVGTALQAYTGSSETMTADVQAWLAGPATNFGWFHRNTEGPGPDASRFGSFENVAASLRPMLTVTFTPVPEPSARLLVGAPPQVGQRDGGRGSSEAHRYAAGWPPGVWPRSQPSATNTSGRR